MMTHHHHANETCSSCEHRHEHHHEHHHHEGGQHRQLLTIIVGGLLLAVAALIEHYAGLATWQLLLVYLVPYLIVGHETLHEAAEGLTQGQPFNEHLLMSVATIGALCIGFLPGAETQFQEAVFVMLFFQVGELFEGYAEGKSRDSIAHLMDIRPDIAHVDNRDVAPETVSPGQTITVRPGERIPLDGIIVEGTSTLNTTALTGESMPRTVGVGDEAISGCINLSGLLRIRTTKSFGDSTASKIIELVENASEHKSQSENLVTRFARVYTPIVVFAAVALAVVPTLWNAVQCSMFNVQCDYARGYVGDTIQSYNGVTVGRSLYETRSQAELTAEAVEKAREADVVIFIGGLNKSNHQDCEGHDRLSYDLPYAQNEVIEAILKVNPRLVYVNISGNGAALPWIDKVPAVVQAWFIGSEAGEAIASVLFGDVNPSGKLPFTWYASLDQCGAHALNAYPGTWREGHKIIDEEYKEGLFVGYRWIDRLKMKKSKGDKVKSEPLFAFGHGLSYTTFQYGKVTADKSSLTADEQITFTVPVTNTGSRAGAETVQLYIRDVESSVERPFKELKAFRKVVLQPGETQQVSLTIDKSALSFYDDKSAAWTAEPGDFEALIGPSSGQIVTRYSFHLQ